MQVLPHQMDPSLGTSTESETVSHTSLGFSVPAKKCDERTIVWRTRGPSKSDQEAPIKGPLTKGRWKSLEVSIPPAALTGINHGASGALKTRGGKLGPVMGLGPPKAHRDRVTRTKRSMPVGSEQTIAAWSTPNNKSRETATASRRPGCPKQPFPRRRPPTRDKRESSSGSTGSLATRNRTQEMCEVLRAPRYETPTNAHAMTPIGGVERQAEDGK